MFDKTLEFSQTTWLNTIYPKIREILDIPRESDVDAIDQLVQRGVRSKQLNIETNSKAICFGAAPDLESYNSYLSDIYEKDVFVGSADGATRWLLEQGYYPDLVVTDLDGIEIEDIWILLDNNAKFQILVHGDNLQSVDMVIDAVEVNTKENISFVTQGAPYHGFNTAIGFTDGDRLVSMLCQNQMSPLLLGFDLSTELIGKYSKPRFNSHQPMTSRKRVKLDIANSILKWLDYHHSIFTPDINKSPGRFIDVRNYLKEL